MYHSRQSRTSCDFANSGSTWASATQWKARSQAAYHGYSHGSGIEITSMLFRCVHSRLRPFQRAVRRRRRVGLALEPAQHVVVEELLAPEHPGERLAHHERLVVGGAGRREVVVELVGLGLAELHHARRSRCRGRRFSARRSSSVAVSPGATSSR